MQSTVCSRCCCCCCYFWRVFCSSSCSWSPHPNPNPLHRLASSTRASSFLALPRLSVFLPLSVSLSVFPAAGAVIQVNAAFIHISKRIIPDVLLQNISKIMLILFRRVQVICPEDLPCPRPRVLQQPLSWPWRRPIKMRFITATTWIILIATAITTICAYNYDMQNQTSPLPHHHHHHQHHHKCLAGPVRLFTPFSLLFLFPFVPGVFWRNACTLFWGVFKRAQRLGECRIRIDPKGNG